MYKTLISQNFFFYYFYFELFYHSYFCAIAYKRFLEVRLQENKRETEIVPARTTRVRYIIFFWSLYRMVINYMFQIVLIKIIIYKCINWLIYHHSMCKNSVFIFPNCPFKHLLTYINFRIIE